MALADSLLVDSITPEDGIALLRRIAEERKSRADRQPLLAFFNSVAERKVDPAVGADALLCAAKTLREEFRFGEARPYWEAAFERQPERTEAERAAKANLWYQIAEDDWYEGNWEKGLDEFVRFARDFSDADHRSLQMYAFFEAIPMIVRKIGMELPNSTGVRDMIAAAAVSENAGERFAGSVALLARGEYDAAMQQAASSVDLSDDSRWTFHRDALTMGVLLRRCDFDGAREIFDRIVEEGKEDPWLARYVLIDGSLLAWLGRHDASLPLHEWYFDSPIYTDPERRDIYSNRIRFDYAIDMTHAGRMEESFGILQELYTREFDTDQGQQAGLIIAEHFLSAGEPDRAEQIVRSVLSTGGNDCDVWARGLLVSAQVDEARGNRDMAAQALRKVLGLPSRPGEEEIGRVKRDAQFFLNRLANMTPNSQAGSSGPRSE
ncbi:MAG TPA: hypothetical protein PLG59_05530 [bacterium]|nr:hypothetical protein [bacterium]